MSGRAARPGCLRVGGPPGVECDREFGTEAALRKGHRVLVAGDVGVEPCLKGGQVEVAVLPGVEVGSGCVRPRLRRLGQRHSGLAVPLGRRVARPGRGQSNQRECRAASAIARMGRARGHGGRCRAWRAPRSPYRPLSRTAPRTCCDPRAARLAATRIASASRPAQAGGESVRHESRTDSSSLIGVPRYRGGADPALFIERTIRPGEAVRPGTRIRLRRGLQRPRRPSPSRQPR